MQSESFPVDSIYNLIDNFLLERGFIDYEIITDSIKIVNTTKLKFLINEGKQYVIKQIFIPFNQLSSKDSLKVNSVFRDFIFNKSNIEKIALFILELLESQGYLFAETKLTGYKLLNGSDNQKYIALKFEINRKEKATISKIEIKGNKFTRRNVIIRESRISEGQIFTPELSKQVLSRLNRLNIFSNISKPEFFLDENKNGILEIQVREGNTNSFDGIIGYIPSTTLGEKGYITGQVNVSLRNLFGTLRSFAFRWNRLNRNSQDLEVKYFEPWILGFPLSITPIFQQYKQDTTYIQRSISGIFDLSISENFSISLNVQSSFVIPQVNYFITNLNRGSIFSYAAGVIYDSRDHPVFTKSGILFRTDFGEVVKKEFLPMETRKYYQRRGNISFSIFQSIFKNQMVYFSLNAKVIDGGGLSISDLFRFGGMNSLRGYEENQFMGSRIFWSNLEYRFLTSYTDYISAFIDYGYYFRDILNERISKFKYGYGVGAAFNTQLGLLKVNFALGEGDTFSKGKIHFGIVSGF